MSDEIPRRCRLEFQSPAERVIGEAQYAVEVSGAHPLLTEASDLLSRAKVKVADYVDLTEKETLETWITPDKHRCGALEALDTVERIVRVSISEEETALDDTVRFENSVAALRYILSAVRDVRGAYTRQEGE